MKNIFFLVVLSFLLTTGFVIAQQPAPVKVEEGLLRGTLEHGVIVFKGVPYAAPPVGKLRWRAPVPHKHWEGIRKADKFSPNPMQIMVRELGPWTAEYQPQGAVSEDCLYLNIWTDSKSSKDKLPVMVYIPGGAFTGGSGDVPVYNGEHLAKKGLVVVTINYRVSVFGFLALPELTTESKHHSSGNYGLLDQVAALEWIRKNISAFGGDPNRVTIMGQSAGAASVNYLTASPLAKGLFIRAIAQSGSNFRMGPGENLKSAEQNGIRFEKAIGAASLAGLRALSAAELIDSVKNNKFRFLPVIDGWFLPKSVDDIFELGEQSDVATLTGWVADEGSYSDSYGKIPAEEFSKNVKQQAGNLADKVLELYPASNDAEASVSQKNLARDISMVSMYLWGLSREKTSKTKLYTYIFTHPQPGATEERYQTFHSSELPYVFDNLNQSPRPWTAEDKRLSRMISDYWTNFITTGDPNGNGLPEWPAFKEITEKTMELGDRMGPRLITTNEKFELLKKLLEISNHNK